MTHEEIINRIHELDEFIEFYSKWNHHNGISAWKSCIEDAEEEKEELIAQFNEQ